MPQPALPWLEEGRKHLGVKEIKGSKHNQAIVQWGKAAGIDWWNNDDDAWCAVFVGGMLAACGLPTTKSALARSYVDYGTRLDPRHPVVGAIVVFPRGTSPTYGHVGFVSKVGDTTIEVLNGNMGDMVKVSTFTRASIIGLAWPPGVPLPAGAVPLGRAVKDDGVLRKGASKTLVTKLQKDLNVLGYKLAENGVYDERVEDAVKRFQERRGMLVDGEAGPATRAALAAAVKAKQAAVKPMPAGGAVSSGTIKGAAAVVATGVGGVVAEVAKPTVDPERVAVAIQAGKEVVEVVQENQEHLAAGTWIGILFFAVAIGVGAFLVWNRYREAGKLPTWLGGKKLTDDVPEEG
jgi:uncharacterized protein (TIGR02594 family)